MTDIESDTKISFHGGQQDRCYLVADFILLLVAQSTPSDGQRTAATQNKTSDSHNDRR